MDPTFGFPCYILALSATIFQGPACATYSGPAVACVPGASSLDTPSPGLCLCQVTTRPHQDGRVAYVGDQAETFGFLFLHHAEFNPRLCTRLNSHRQCPKIIVDEWRAQRFWTVCDSLPPAGGDVTVVRPEGWRGAGDLGTGQEDSATDQGGRTHFEHLIQDLVVSFLWKS